MIEITKDTIIGEVLKQIGDEGFLSVSMTTRAKREFEKEGVHYYFVSEEQFRSNIENDLMLEYAQYGSNYYGTPVGPIRDLLEKGRTVILNIEVTGGKNVRRLLPQAIEIFVAPPSLEELERRLYERGSESPEEILKRMNIAKEEMNHSCDYDYIVVNDELTEAVDDVMAIIRASRLKKEKTINKICEVIKNA